MLWSQETGSADWWQQQKKLRDFSHIACLGQLGWAGHVAKMERDKATYTKLSWITALGRHRSKREGNIKMVF
jgi:hypothetical protein